MKNSWKVYLIERCTILNQEEEHSIQLNYKIVKSNHPSEEYLHFIAQLKSKGFDYKEFSSYLLKKTKKDELSNLAKHLYVQGLLEFKLTIQNTDSVFSVEILTSGYSFSPLSIIENKEYAWSKFSLLRQDKNGWLLESPLSKIQIKFSGKVLWDLLYFIREHTSLDSVEKEINISSETLKNILGVLHQEKFLDAKSSDQLELGAALDQWEFHDLYFHSRSRLGRHNNPAGGNYPFKEKIQPLPAIRPNHHGPITKLPIPNPHLYANRDATFTQVLESRVSGRMNGYGHISIFQLSEFLYRSARVRGVMPPSDSGESTNRPYPNGGASYELEIYLTIDRCKDLDPGFYHYCPLKHQLTLLSPYNDIVKQSMIAATWATGQVYAPPVLIQLAARFQRVSWKYQSMAYALILKNTGVLYQTFYLVGTAMGLNPCGIGIGDSDHFAEMSGNEYLEETTVGEFMLTGATYF